MASGLILSGCKPTELPAELSVDHVLRNYDRLDGKVIEVRGRLAGCQPYGCLLLDDHREDKYLSLGESQIFDRATAGLRGKTITVSGKLNAECIAARLKPGKARLICIDRVGELDEPKLVLTK